MPDDERIQELETEIARLKKRLEDKEDEESAKDRQDFYRLSLVDKKTAFQVVHGNLVGLAADDHTHYLNNSRHDVSARHGDAVIGNRTVDDESAPTGNEGNLSTLLGWIGYMIKAVTGKTNWRTAPATTLEAAKGHMDDTDNPHSVTAAQAGALEEQSGSSLPSATEADRGQFFTVKGGEGVEDQVYVCVKDDEDGYVWREVSLL